MNTHSKFYMVLRKNDAALEVFIGLVLGAAFVIFCSGVTLGYMLAGGN